MQDMLIRKRRIPKHLVEKLIANITAHDHETLLPDILHALENTETKPNIREEEWTYSDENEIELYTDGSYDDENQKEKGTYAIEVGPQNHNTCVIVPRAYSSFEVEIRAIIHALAITPWGKSMVIYTDSGSSIDAIKRVYTNTHVKKRRIRDEKLIERTIALIKRKEAAGATVKIRFVYSHLRDEEENNNVNKITPEQKQEKERKENTMKEMYGEKFETILQGNKTADNLTKEINNSPQVIQHAAMDPAYIIRIEGRDSTWKTRAACYEHLTAIETQQNRKVHPNAYDWMKSDKIDKTLSQILLTDNSRKLTKTRHFMFKLRNDKLKTMEKMHERQKANKNDSHYAKHVLAKYTSDICPLCTTAKESGQHITECSKTADIRDNTTQKIYKLIQSKIKEIKQDEVTATQEKITYRKKNQKMVTSRR